MVFFIELRKLKQAKISEESRGHQVELKRFASEISLNGKFFQENPSSLGNF